MGGGASRLDLRSNDIHDAGLDALAEGMECNASVESLFVWGNHFGQVCSDICFARRCPDNCTRASPFAAADWAATSPIDGKSCAAKPVRDFDGFRRLQIFVPCLKN